MKQNVSKKFIYIPVIKTTRENNFAVFEIMLDTQAHITHSLTLSGVRKTRECRGNSSRKDIKREKSKCLLPSSI
jgi:hypothetical protein